MRSEVSISVIIEWSIKKRGNEGERRGREKERKWVRKCVAWNATHLIVTTLIVARDLIGGGIETLYGNRSLT